MFEQFKKYYDEQDKKVIKNLNVGIAKDRIKQSYLNCIDEMIKREIRLRGEYVKNRDRDYLQEQRKKIEEYE